MYLLETWITNCTYKVNLRNQYCSFALFYLFFIYNTFFSNLLFFVFSSVLWFFFFFFNLFMFSMEKGRKEKLKKSKKNICIITFNMGELRRFDGGNCKVIKFKLGVGTIKIGLNIRGFTGISPYIKISTVIFWGDDLGWLKND